jgi:hypothetical protein
MDFTPQADNTLSTAVTNARLAAFHGLSVVPVPPLDDARSTPQTARSSRARIRKTPQERRASVCGRRRDVSLRLRFAKRSSPLSAHFPRSPTTDRSQTVRIRGQVMNSPISDWPISDFPITDCKIGEPFGLLPGQHEENPLNCMAASVASRILRLARLNARASVPPLTRPPPPGEFCL